MRVKRLKVFMVSLGLLLLLGANTFWTERADAQNRSMAPARPTTTCNSCRDCSDKLATESYSEVRLTVDLINQGGTCVATLLGESDNTFNCDGHIIDGDDVAIDPDQGIAFFHGTNNSVLNCVVTDFSSGIYLADAIGNTVENSEMRSNGIGLKLSLATFSIIEGNTIEDNYTGIYMYMADSSTLTGNRVCNNSVTDFDMSSTCGQSGTANQCNVPDGWNDDGTTGCTYPCWTCWIHMPLISR
jgi:parallel beta-helix repeat protein